MRINHNIAALNTYRQLNGANEGASKSMEKLSSGLRINRAGDDAAGLAISEKMRGQIRGLDQASRNAQDGISFIQTAEGALNETHDILQRMRELAVQSSNDTNTDADRDELQKEVDQLAGEITRISNNTEFNTKSLLNGAVSDNGEKSAVFQIGANNGQNLSLEIKAMDAKSLGVTRDTTEATATVKSGADIGSVTIGDTVGSKVIDSANITFDYASTTDQAAKITATGSFTSADLAALSDGDNEIVISVDGTDYTLNETALKAWDNASGHDAIGDTVAFLGNAVDGSGNKLSTVATISDNGSGKLTIEDKTIDGGTVSIAINGASASTVEGVFGFDSTETSTGTTAGKAITVSDGSASKTFSITDETATTFSTGSDSDWGGLSISMTSGADLSDLDQSGDGLTMSVTTNTSTSATFNSGSKTADASVAGGIDISSQSAADSAITEINEAIETVSAERSKLGAYQNRLEHTINNLGTSSENLTAAESRIRDVDYALAA
ncbi:flagellin [Bacillus sp. P14.5]|uniref:flagellin N-terminal helical domain-containing protein n=1 Tax=Bacillus sp. P14.5 TaxID=1983400 RepID=UPI000DE8967F|nr:flagellin [Bacillus sp. P14.5]